MAGLAELARSRRRGGYCWVSLCGALFAACGGRTLEPGDQGPATQGGGGAVSVAAHAGTVHGGSSAVGLGGGVAVGGVTSGGVLTVGGHAEGGYAEGGYAEGGYAEGGYAEGGAGGPVGGDAGAAGAATCELNGRSYRAGQQFRQGCIVCTCSADGSVACNALICAKICARYRALFIAATRVASRCDPLDPLACQAGTQPRSLSCGCPVASNSAVQGDNLWRVRTQWLEGDCGKPDPDCDTCPVWDTPYCGADGFCMP